MTGCGYEIQGQQALITLDNPPMNGLGHGLRDALREALERALADAAVSAIVLTGSPRAFSCGADLREFDTSRAGLEPSLASLIGLIESSAKPVIAAIAGVCMGGGLELALACHFRVAQQDAQIGLPEVKLGLLPGAGGTQRLPRLIGLEPALNMIVSGSSSNARELAESGLFVQVVPSEVIGAALAFARRVMTERLPLVRARDQKLSDPQAEAFLQFARSNVAATANGFPAPLKCVEAVATAYTKPFDQGLALERELFLSLMSSPQSKALRHGFAAERAAAKIAGLPADTVALPVASVGVVGAGTMGTGIAMNFLNAGLPVVLLEMNPPALARGLAQIRKNYEATARKGRLTAQQVEQRMALITPTLDYAAFEAVDLVIEAAFEEMSVKLAVIEQLDRACKPGAMLASNTSYLDIDRIAASSQRPERVLGLHFFSPANVMRLLEIVRGRHTAPAVLATCMALARRIGKIAVVAGVCDGFIGNRMLTKYTAAATELLNAGAAPAQIDAALQRFGMAMGPYRMGDLAGLDIGWATRKRRAAEAGVALAPSIADRLCEAGRFGQKTGAGWYRYEAGARSPLADPVTEQIIDAFRAVQGITPRRVADEEIVERCMLALVNEGAKILEQGIAARASDIDLVFLNGYGFPKQHGGPMFHAAAIGLSNVLRSLRRFAAEPGADPAWRPAALIEQLAANAAAFS